MMISPSLKSNSCVSWMNKNYSYSWKLKSYRGHFNQKNQGMGAWVAQYVEYDLISAQGRVINLSVGLSAILGAFIKFSLSLWPSSLIVLYLKTKQKQTQN